MRRNMIVLCVIALALSAGGVSMSRVGLASDGSSANDSNKANVNVESQPRGCRRHEAGLQTIGRCPHRPTGAAIRR